MKLRYKYHIEGFVDGLGIVQPMYDPAEFVEVDDKLGAGLLESPALWEEWKAADVEGKDVTPSAGPTTLAGLDQQNEMQAAAAKKGKS